MEIDGENMKQSPILKYRIKHFAEGRNVRGITVNDSRRCALVLDDFVIAGDYHFPCVIYMREKGQPIGKVSSKMRRERKEWFDRHDSFNDKICRDNCLDVCVDYNNKYREINKITRPSKPQRKFYNNVTEHSVEMPL